MSDEREAIDRLLRDLCEEPPSFGIAGTPDWRRQMHAWKAGAFDRIRADARSIRAMRGDHLAPKE